jgi:hypothetical protein
VVIKLKKLISLIAVFVLSLFVFAGTVSACGKPYDKPNWKPDCGWNIKGEYTIDYTLTGGGVYSHVYNIDTVNKFTGDFSGTGHYVPDASYTEIITGKVTGSNLVFHVLYTGSNAGYTVDAVGTIADDGSLSGTATGPGQSFTWVASIGKANKYEYCWRWGRWIWNKHWGWRLGNNN